MEDNKCPICNTGERLPNNKQPESSLHAFTILYDCGSEIIYPLGTDEIMIEIDCTTLITKDNND